MDEQGDDASIISRAEGAEEGEEVEGDDNEDDAEFDPVAEWHPNNPYQVRTDLPNILSEQLY